MKKKLWEKYIGIPYVHAGRDPKIGLDCYGLVMLYYKEILNKGLKDWWYEKDWEKRGHNYFLEQAENFNFKRVDKPKKHDIVLLRMDITSPIPNHIAVIVKPPHIALCGLQHGVTLLDFSRNVLKRRIEGIYRCQN